MAGPWIAALKVSKLSDEYCLKPSTPFHNKNENALFAIAISCKGERFTSNLQKFVLYPLDAWLLIIMMMMNRLLLLTILHFVIQTAKAATLFYQTDITLFFSHETLFYSLKLYFCFSLRLLG